MIKANIKDIMKYTGFVQFLFAVAITIKEENKNEEVKENNSNNASVTTSSNNNSKDDYFTNSKLERNTMYSQMLETYEKVLNSNNSLETQKQSATEEIKKINNLKNNNKNIKFFFLNY